MHYPNFSKLTKALFAASLVSAIAAPALHAADATIGPDAWREMTEGKTLHYYQDGKLHGREYYYPGGQKVEFCSADGFHAVGRWAFSDDTYCFAYFGDLHCFRHVMRDGEIVVVDVNDSADEQTVGKITNGGPFPCSEGSAT